MRFKKILVAVDFSPASREAMRTAAALAAESGAQLTVAHFWQVPLLGAELPLPAQYVDDVRNGAEQQLATWVAEASSLSDRPVTSVFELGVPWDEAVKLLRRDHYDLAVVGTHGRTGLKHVLLGSVAEKIVRHAPCAVLVVR
ncbi:MAG TPA: universal stress protein [Kofleriaceae bacterium]